MICYFSRMYKSKKNTKLVEEEEDCSMQDFSMEEEEPTIMGSESAHKKISVTV